MSTPYFSLAALKAQPDFDPDEQLDLDDIKRRLVAHVQESRASAHRRVDEWYDRIEAQQPAQVAIIERELGGLAKH